MMDFKPEKHCLQFAAAAARSLIRVRFAVLFALVALIAGTTCEAQAAAPPLIAKAFGPIGIQPNGVSTLTVTISNPTANTVALVGIAFNDSFPANLFVATPNGLTNSCGGTAVANAGSQTVSLAGGTVAVNGSCTVTVNVTASFTGSYSNTTGAVSSTNGGTGGTASATLFVANPPRISKLFLPNAIVSGSSTLLSFTIDNPNSNSTPPNADVTLTGIQFTDTLPAGLMVATPNGLSNSCGGTVTAVAGGSSITLTGGMLAPAIGLRPDAAQPAAGDCFISVSVTATEAGNFDNTSARISANESGSGATSNTTMLTVTPKPATHDFNGDGKADIAWRDGAGDLALWLMNGAAVLSSAGLGNAPAVWSIVGQRDFDGDGKADLLWRDTGGNTAIWFLNGAQVTSSASIGDIPTNWSVVGTGDFDGDGKGDILWRDSAGDLAVWLMNGSTVVSSAALANVPASFTIAGIGDFDGDGKADILWVAPSGISMWFMNGTQVSSSAIVNAAASGSVVGTGDFNGDGKSDIVWRDNSGNTSIWLMNGAAVASMGSLGNVPTTWSIVETGDYNGDGMSDLLWRDTSGNTAIWFMNGVNVGSSMAVGNISTIWTVQAVNAD
jgi:hypothetical protein